MWSYLQYQLKELKSWRRVWYRWRENALLGSEINVKEVPLSNSGTKLEEEQLKSADFPLKLKKMELEYNVRRDEKDFLHWSISEVTSSSSDEYQMVLSLTDGVILSKEIRFVGSVMNDSQALLSWYKAEVSELKYADIKNVGQCHGQSEQVCGQLIIVPAGIWFVSIPLITRGATVGRYTPSYLSKCSVLGLIAQTKIMKGH